MVLLLLSTVLLALGGAALAASGPEDRCLMLDSCYYKTEAKSCSCKPDCHLYGTCCLGVKEGPPDHSGLPAFRCYGRRTRDAIFVRRSCKPDYRGHPQDGAACVDDDEDEADVVNNLLVTNRLTKVTYWNKLCAKCNNEDMSKLEYWNIVVRCESREGVNKGSIRRYLTFEPDMLTWGLKVGEHYVQCLVHYSPPASLEEIKYCTPNVIQACPPDYPDRERAQKCSQSYAERKLKNGDVYFRNVHCALCNGIDEKDVECPGMSSGPKDSTDESDFRNVTEVVFSGGEWQHRLFECSPNYAYDPFRGKCRTYRTRGGGDIPLNSAPVCSRMSYLLLATLSTVLLL